MNHWGIILKEMRRRPGGFLFSSVAIVAAIMVLVSVRMLGESSYKGLMEDLHDIGSGYMVINRDARPVDILRGEQDVPMLSENITRHLVSIGIGEADNLYPRIYRRIELKGHEFILTGVMPPKELVTREDQDIASSFLKKIAEGMKIHAAHTGDSQNAPGGEEGEVHSKMIIEAGSGSHETSQMKSAAMPMMNMAEKTRLENNLFNGLRSREVILGASAAKTLDLEPGDVLSLNDLEFKVKNVLESTGDRDDVRIFMHLHAMQELYGLGSNISNVEILGCCVDRESAPVLKAGIENNLKSVRVVTMQEVAKTRMNAFSLSKKIATPLVFILLLIGASAIASQTIGSLRTRRKEIGILVSLGAPQSLIRKLFLGKALILGVWSGAVGFFLGAFTAWIVGNTILGYPVVFIPYWLPMSVIGAVAVTMFSTLVPLASEYRKEPALVLREE